MAKTPLVSVVVPIYNVEKYVEECVESIIHQTYDNLEIILVDDGSKDESGRIADDFAKKDSRITVLHKVNGGLSDARNAGIRIAKGEYITFVDSDDWISHQFVNELIQVAEGEGADIVQCDNSRDPHMIDSGSGGLITITGSGAFIDLINFKTISPTAWGKLYKTRLLKEGNLQFPVGRIHEDTAILYKLIYQANRVTCLAKCLYYYRLNNNSIMTSAYAEHHYSSVILYHEELDEFIISNKIEIKDTVLNRHKALRYLSVLNKLALSRENQKEAYQRFRSEYVSLSIRSGSVLCIAAIVPVMIPQAFRTSRKVVPLFRHLIGKA